MALGASRRDQCVEDRRQVTQEWTEITVPAIVSQDTFDRVAQRLVQNKSFASRNSKGTSLLQGLAACAGVVTFVSP
jgi:site-specific DNA recombinase